MPAPAAKSAKPLPLKTSGTVEEHQLYIERPEDDIVYSLLREGTYCNILTSRQMGKSSLVVRLRKRLAANGIRVLSISLEGVGGNQLIDARAWYKAVLQAIALKQDGSLDLFDAWWKKVPDDQPLAGVVRAFVEHMLLREEGAVVVVLDEVDVTRALPFTDDLFLAMRALHNERSERPELARVTFCLLGVLATGDLIKVASATPYNIGSTVRLSDFSRERCDLSPLDDHLNAHGLDGPALLDEVLTWTRGQPFLTIALCDKLVSRAGVSVEKLVSEEVADPTAFGVHFGRIEYIVRERITGDSKVRDQYLRMLRGERIQGIAERDEESLLLAGLVRRDDEGMLVLRNRIYQRRFNRRWVARVLPASPIPRWVYGLVAALVVVLFVVVGASYWKREQEQRADELAAARETQRIEIETLRALNGLATVDNDAEAEAIWRGLKDKGIDVTDKRLAVAAKGYWLRANGRFDSLARALLEADCPEEAHVLNALAAARTGEAMPRMGPLAAHTSAISWIPQQLPPDDSALRCRARRKPECRRLSVAGGKLTVSCDGHLWSLAADGEVGELSGARGRRAMPLPLFEGASVGHDKDTLVFAFEGETYSPRVCASSKEVRDLEVTSHAGRLGVAYVCSDQKFGYRYIEDVGGWLSSTKTLGARWHEGRKAMAVTWLAGRLVRMVPGRYGMLVTATSALPLPYLIALSSATEHTSMLAFTTEEPLMIGTGEWREGRMHIADRFSVARLCKVQRCLVTKVALGEQGGVLVGVLRDLEPDGTLAASRLLRRVEDDWRVLPLQDAPSDIVVLQRNKEMLVALSEPGRVRLLSREPRQPETWDDVKRRFGLGVIGDGPTLRVVRLSEAARRQPRRFEDVFAP